MSKPPVPSASPITRDAAFVTGMDNPLLINRRPETKKEMPGAPVKALLLLRRQSNRALQEGIPVDLLDGHLPAEFRHGPPVRSR